MTLCVCYGCATTVGVCVFVCRICGVCTRVCCVGFWPDLVMACAQLFVTVVCDCAVFEFWYTILCVSIVFSLCFFVPLLDSDCRYL